MQVIFIMQHPLTDEQREAAEKIGEVVELSDKSLLNVPDDPSLNREWFVGRAQEILDSLGVNCFGDLVHVMGQQQLAMAVIGQARQAGALIIESVTSRESVEEKQPDGSVRKTNVFRFNGFRHVYQYDV